MAFVPLQPPDAVHEVAFVEVHVNVLLAPLLTVVGDADRLTVGAGVGLVTVTDAVDCAVPPAPVQLNVNVAFALNAPVLVVPDTDLDPLQPPEAVQELALVDDHVSVLALPLVTVVGDAVNVTVGAGVGLVTVTEAVDCAAPPAPVQRSVKLLLALNAPVLAVPDTVFVPLQPPDAVHDVAFVDVHVSVLALPLATVVGDADKVTVGAGFVPSTTTDALASADPPAPVQRSVKVPLAVIPPVLSRPETDLAPVHSPEAAQEVALVELHVSVLALPLVMVVGDADNVTVGAGVGPPATVTVVLA